MELTRSKYLLVPPFFMLLWIGFGFTFWAMNGLGGQALLFLMLTMALFFYLFWELWGNYKKYGGAFLIQPVVLASFFVFIDSYGLNNLQYLGADSELNRYFMIQPEPFKWMNLTMVGVLLGAFAMWRGYRSFYALKIGRHIRRFFINKKLLRNQFTPNYIVLYSFIFISVAAQILAIKLGIGGYFADPKGLRESASISMWLHFLKMSGWLCLAVIALYCFSLRRRITFELRALFFVVLLLQFLSGLLSGFKSQVVMPFIIVGISYFVIKKSVPKRWVILAFVVLVFSYAVIGPLRVERYADRRLDNRDVASVVSTVNKVIVKVVTGEKDSKDKSVRIHSRDALTLFSAHCIALTKRFGVPADSPDFFNELLFSPIYAVIPRFIWPEKPISRHGSWFYTQVLKKRGYTAVGMGPIGYLYFAGGFIGVFLGFFVIGFLQRICYVGFAEYSAGGWLVYIGLISTIAIIPSEVNAVFQSVIRNIPILVGAQYLLLKR